MDTDPKTVPKETEGLTVSPSDLLVPQDTGDFHRGLVTDHPNHLFLGSREWGQTLPRLHTRAGRGSRGDTPPEVTGATLRRGAVWSRTKGRERIE